MSDTWNRVVLDNADEVERLGAITISQLRQQQTDSLAAGLRAVVAEMAEWAGLTRPEDHEQLLALAVDKVMALGVPEQLDAQVDRLEQALQGIGRAGPH